MSSTKENTEIVAWLRKASQAIYLATDESVADDISPKLKIAASEIERLRDVLLKCGRLITERHQEGDADYQIVLLVNDALLPANTSTAAKATAL